MSFGHWSMLSHLFSAFRRDGVRKMHTVGPSLQKSLLRILDSCDNAVLAKAPKANDSMKIVISAYSKDYITSYAEFVHRSVSSMGGKSKELHMIRYLLKRWTVLSSPFVHKKSRTQLERRTFKREIFAFGLNSEQQKLLTWYLRRNAPPGLDFIFEIQV